jgi:hypothetical protein
LQDAVEFLANLMIPKSEHNDPVASQKFRSRSIANLSGAIVMPTTVQFDRELCGRTIEIQDVTADWMLTSKFVACKISVPQMPPTSVLSVGGLLAQRSGTIHEESF